MSKVSLLGAPDSTSLLARYMLAYSPLCDSNSSSFEAILLDAKKYLVDNAFELRVDNKYYTTSLDCRLLTQLEDNEIDAYESVLTIPDDTSAVSSSMTALSSALESSPRRDDGVYLCIVLKDDSNAAGVDSFRPARVDWCIDSGFEYIEIDTALPMESHQDRDKFGVPRVMEALQSNRWRHMVMKTQHTPTQPAEQVATRDNTSKAPDDAMTSVFRVEPVSASEESEVQSPLADEEEEKEEQIQQVLQLAQKTREEVMAGSLSDDQRRERAARIALQMCSLMNLDDDSDEEEEDD